MKFLVEINTDNAAFENVGPEVARILREIAAKVEHVTGAVDAETISVRDYNGNKVGTFGFDEV